MISPSSITSNVLIEREAVHNPQKHSPVHVFIACSIRIDIPDGFPGRRPPLLGDHLTCHD